MGDVKRRNCASLMSGDASHRGGPQRVFGREGGGTFTNAAGPGLWICSPRGGIRWAANLGEDDGWVVRRWPSGLRRVITGESQQPDPEEEPRRGLRDRAGAERQERGRPVMGTFVRALHTALTKLRRNLPGAGALDGRVERVERPVAGDRLAGRGIARRNWRRPGPPVAADLNPLRSGTMLPGVIVGVPEATVELHGRRQEVQVVRRTADPGRG